MEVNFENLKIRSVVNDCTADIRHEIALMKLEMDQQFKAIEDDKSKLTEAVGIIWTLFQEDSKLRLKKKLNGSELDQIVQGLKEIQRFK